MYEQMPRGVDTNKRPAIHAEKPSPVVCVLEVLVYTSHCFTTLACTLYFPHHQSYRYMYSVCVVCATYTLGQQYLYVHVLYTLGADNSARIAPSLCGTSHSRELQCTVCRHAAGRLQDGTDRARQHACRTVACCGSGAVGRRFCLKRNVLGYSQWLDMLGHGCSRDVLNCQDC
jgi:hypothetical protein